MMRALLIPVAAAIILSGCNFDMALYVSDLRDVADGTEASILTPVVLGLEVGSCDEYEEFAEEAPELAAGVTTGLVSGLRTKGCVRNELGHFLQAEAQVPIVADPRVWRETDSILGVLVKDHDGNIAVTLLVEQQKQEVLWDRLENEGGPLPDTSRVAIKLVLENDLRDLQTYVAESVFVDGLAIVEPERFELKRRQMTEVVLSNVAALRLATYGAVHALILETSPKPAVQPDGESSLPSAAAVASKVPAAEVPPGPRPSLETASARAAWDAGVPEAYYVRMRGQVSVIAARSYPRRSLDLSEEGAVVMLIRIREDGSVVDITIEEERTNASLRLQRAAQRAVLRAAPFDRLPAGAGVKSILLPVVYSITGPQS